MKTEYKMTYMELAGQDGGTQKRRAHSPLDQGYPGLMVNKN